MKKFIPTKYQVARMQTAFILDDVEYVKTHLKTAKIVQVYDLYFYKKYDKNLWYYILKKSSHNVLFHLLSLGCSINIYPNISINTNFVTLIDITNKLDDVQYKLLYIDNYESFIKYIVNILCNMKHFDKLIDILNIVDSNRFDIYSHLEDIRYIYTHELAASNFIRQMKFKEIQNII